MSVGAVVTLGYGTFTTVNFIPTLGYGTGALPPTPSIVIQIGGAGEELSWKEHLEAVHKKRVLERDLQLYGKRLKKTVLAIRAAEKKISVAGKKSKSTEGILDNLWKLEEKKEELKLQIQKFKQSLLDMETMLIASQKLDEYSEDEEEIEMLLLQ